MIWGVNGVVMVELADVIVVVLLELGAVVVAGVVDVNSVDVMTAEVLVTNKVVVTGVGVVPSEVDIKVVVVNDCCSEVDSIVVLETVKVVKTVEGFTVVLDEI